MRLLSFIHEGRSGFGVLTAEGIVDLSGRWPSLKALLGEDALGRVSEAAGERIPLEAVSLQPPIPDPGKILCLGTAYRAHVIELGRPMPTHPSLFVRFPGSFVGHGEAIVRPFLSTEFDFEAELGVVIGKAGRHIPADRALAHVAGYTCVAENSVRDFQQHNAQVTPGKNFDRTGSVGPWLVTADEVPDPSRLSITGRLNGVVMQHAELSDLLFTVADIIAYISSFTELQPGDLISTGTPSGVGALRKPPVFMKPGDVFEVEVPGVGVLANPVVDEEPIP